MVLIFCSVLPMIGQKQWPTITVSLGALALALSSMLLLCFFAFTSNWLWAREISWDNNDSNDGNSNNNWSVIGNKTHSWDCNLIVSGQQVNGNRYQVTGNRKAAQLGISQMAAQPTDDAWPKKQCTHTHTHRQIHTQWQSEPQMCRNILHNWPGMQIAKWLKCLMYLPQNWRPKRSTKPNQTKAIQQKKAKNLLQCHKQQNAFCVQREV